MARQQEQINFENCSQKELEIATKVTPTRRNFFRLNSINRLFYKTPRKIVARAALVTERSMINWINKFNEGGINALIEKPREGRPRKNNQVIDCEPNCLDKNLDVSLFINGTLHENVQNDVNYAKALKWSDDSSYRLDIPAPWPVDRDEANRTEYAQRLKHYLLDNETELWFYDEMGVEADPRPRRRIVRKSQTVYVVYEPLHIRMNVSGIICARSMKVLYNVSFNSNVETFQQFLNRANSSIHFQRKRNVLILDRATWHTNQKLDFGSFEPMYLPPFSTDFNLIECLWILLRNKWFVKYSSKNRLELIRHIEDALLWTVNDNPDIYRNFDY